MVVLKKKADKQALKNTNANNDSLPNILELLEHVNVPLKFDEILSIGNISRKNKSFLQAELVTLLDTGKAIRLVNGTYFATTKMAKQSGTLQVQRAGMGFVLPDKLVDSEARSSKKNKEDIYIHPDHFGDAWNGDRVEVAILPKKQGKRPEGQIIAVLERGRKELLVKVLHDLGRSMPFKYMAIPVDARLDIALLVDVKNLAEAANNPEFITKLVPDSLLMIKLGERLKKENHNVWSAEATELVNEQDALRVQERLVKANHNIAIEFEEAVLAEAAKLPVNPQPADFKDREDLQELGFVTIDGPDAKDFDDAILINKTESGFCLQVAIADVAHYVPSGSALDLEALKRGNSCYFPLSVEPMLPEALSNNLCSLNPHVPRLVMLAKIFFDKNGNPHETHFANAVIKSVARLTYEQVFAVLEGGDIAAVEASFSPAKKISPIAPVLPMLLVAKELALLLKERRKDRGSLEFELPEPKAVLDNDGKLVDLAKRQQNFANQLIEEFMLAANEAVGRFLHQHKIPALFRNHPEPDLDKLDNLFNTLSTTELHTQLPSGFFDKPGVASIAPLLLAVKNTPQEFITSRLALRSMMQARYSPELEGHFGLASTCYCHFTSPIRRYADLLVHRSLKYALAAADAPKSLLDIEELSGVADHINTTERAAIDAEREIFKRLSVILLQGKIGETFSGVVSGLTDFGMFVELSEIVAEGMIRIASLRDDYYDYVQERNELRGSTRGRIFKLGMPLSMKLVEVNSERLEITFEIIEENQAEFFTREKRPFKAKNKQQEDKEKYKNTDKKPIASDFAKRKKKAKLAKANLLDKKNAPAKGTFKKKTGAKFEKN